MILVPVGALRNQALVKRQLQCTGATDPLSITQDSLFMCRVEWYCVFNAEIKSAICFQNINLGFTKSETEGSLKANSSSGGFFGQCCRLSVGDA